MDRNIRNRNQRWLGWKVVSLLGRYRARLAGLIVLLLIASALDLAVPFLTRGLIDRIVPALKTTVDGSVQVLVFAAVAIFVATAATRIIRSVYNYTLLNAASQCEDEVKNAAFLNFLKLDTSYHGAVNTGEVVGARDRGGTTRLLAKTCFRRS